MLKRFLATACILLGCISIHAQYLQVFPVPEGYTKTSVYEPKGGACVQNQLFLYVYSVRNNDTLHQIQVIDAQTLQETRRFNLPDDSLAGPHEFTDVQLLGGKTSLYVFYSLRRDNRKQSYWVWELSPGLKPEGPAVEVISEMEGVPLEADQKIIWDCDSSHFALFTYNDNQSERATGLYYYTAQLKRISSYKFTFKQWNLSIAEDFFPFYLSPSGKFYFVETGSRQVEVFGLSGNFLQISFLDLTKSGNSWKTQKYAVGTSQFFGINLFGTDSLLYVGGVVCGEYHAAVKYHFIVPISRSGEMPEELLNLEFPRAFRNLFPEKKGITDGLAPAYLGTDAFGQHWFFSTEAYTLYEQEQEYLHLEHSENSLILDFCYALKLQDTATEWIVKSRLQPPGNIFPMECWFWMNSSGIYNLAYEIPDSAYYKEGSKSYKFNETQIAMHAWNSGDKQPEALTKFSLKSRAVFPMEPPEPIGPNVFLCPIYTPSSAKNRLSLPEKPTGSILLFKN